MRDVRLGDDIDDFCVRCKRVMNHAVVSVINGAAAKVRCRTCYSDHDYRHEQAPPPKVDARKAALFNEVLKKVNPDAVIDGVDEIPDVEIDSEVDVDVEGDGDGEGAAVIAEDVPPADEEEAKPKKGKGRAKK